MAQKFETPDCQNCKARFRSVFCDLQDLQLRELSLNKGCTQFKKGQVVFHEGMRPSGLFCINSGKVKLSKMGSEGKEQIVRLARSGDILGYRSLLSGDHYSLTAYALEDSNICFIPKSTFFNVLNQDVNLSMQMMKLLSSDLKHAEEKITELAQKPVRERLAEALLFIKETYGYTEDGITLNVSLTREDIANVVGTATETAIRLLSEFNQDEIIKLNGRKISIIDSERLIKTANLIE